MVSTASLHPYNPGVDAKGLARAVGSMGRAGRARGGFYTIRVVWRRIDSTDEGFKCHASNSKGCYIRGVTSARLYARAAAPPSPSSSSRT